VFCIGHRSGITTPSSP